MASEGRSLDELLAGRSRRLRHVVLLLSLGCILGLGAFALPHLLPARPYGLGSDYRVFFAAGELARDGVAPYHLGPLRHLEQVALPYPTLLPALTVFVGPPVLAFVLVPLSLLPLWLGFALLTVLGVVLVAVTVTLLARDLGWRHTGLLVGAALVSWVGLLGFLAGQVDAVLLGALAGSMLLAWHERGLAAGLVLGLTLVKPTLLWPVPIFMFLALWPERRRAWHFALGYLIVAAAFLGVSWPWLGAWGHRLLDFGHGVATQQPDLAGLPGLLGAAPAAWGLGRGILAGPTLLVVALGLLGMAIFGAWMMMSKDWRRVSPVGRVTWAVAIPVGLWLLTTPYARPNDDLLLLPLFMVTVGGDARRVHGLGLGLSLASVVLFLLIWPAGVVPWEVGLAAFAALTAWVWWRRTDPHLTGFGAGLCLLCLVALPPVWAFHLLPVGLTPVAILVLVAEGGRTCWMEVGGAGTGPAYVESTSPAEIATSPGGA